MKNFIKTILLYPLLIVIMIIEFITTKLKKKNPDRYECVNCKKVFDKPQKCECGESRYIINPKKYKVEGNNILCGCSRDGELEHEYHFDCEDGFIEEYMCSGCFRTLSIYYYIDDEDDKIIKFGKKKTRYECINCKKVFDEPQKCECGGNRYIMNPKKYRVVGDQILCGCDKNGKLVLNIHADCIDGCLNKYICSGCSSELSIYYYAGENCWDIDLQTDSIPVDDVDDDLFPNEDIEMKKMPWHK